MRKNALVAALLCSAALAQTGEKLAGGPYVVNVTGRGATVMWIVETGEAALGTDPAQLTRKAPALHAEKISYTGLQPGRTYHYQILGREDGRGRFKTAPAKAEPFSFLVYGDTRTRHDFHRKVMEAMAAEEPDLILHTGDLVADGADTAQWPVFFSIERELLRKAAFFPVLGNHERNNPQYHQFFDVAFPYYSFDWANAHFTILNSDIGNAVRTREEREEFWSKQLQWLEGDLQRSQKADFRFAVFHHPPYTAVKRRQGGNRDVQRIIPLLEKHKVTSVFNGHDHNYQHHFRNGVHYIVTGGGGAPLYPVDGAMEGITLKVESTEHYVRVKVDGKTARSEAVALDGRVIDTVEMTAGVPPPTQQ